MQQKNHRLMELVKANLQSVTEEIRGQENFITHQSRSVQTDGVKRGCTRERAKVDASFNSAVVSPEPLNLNN